MSGNALDRSELRRVAPEFLDLAVVRENLEKWFADEEFIEHMIEGLRKASIEAAST